MGNTINLIAISGKINAGKDTVGRMINYITSEAYTRGRTYDQFLSRSSNPEAFGTYYQQKYEIKKFAYKLKEIASKLTGVPIDNFENHQFKDSNMPEQWNDVKRAYIHKSEYDKYKEDNPDSVKDMVQINDSNYYVDYITPMTYRQFLQKLGTEMGRSLHPNAWVNALFADYVEDEGWSYPVEVISKNGDTAKIKLEEAPSKFNNGLPNWLITDCRFPNEAQAVKDRGGIVIRVDRYREVPLEECVIPKDSQLLHPSETALDSYNFDYVINNNDTEEHLLEEVKKMLTKFEIAYG